MMLAVRALEYDLARSRRADIGHLEHVVADLAELGFTMMTLNLEHRFDFPGCPGIAPPGSLTPALARRLVAFGRERGLDVVPQPNLIGHCEGLCATQKYAHLSADPYQQQPWGGYEQLNLELPEARELVRTMLDGVCESFPGQYIHIGGDEVRRMVEDTVELGLEGFMIATWEWGFGTAPDLIWPWCAHAIEIAEHGPQAADFDAGEAHWLDIHEASLDAHLAALRARRADGDALLEFGEFLRRPAHITQRLTWR